MYQTNKHLTCLLIVGGGEKLKAILLGIILSSNLLDLFKLVFDWLFSREWDPSPEDKWGFKMFKALTGPDYVDPINFYGPPLKKLWRGAF